MSSLSALSVALAHDRDPAVATVAAALRPQRLGGPTPCPACQGDGALPIDPIREDGGVVWSILPCEECQGTGVVCPPA